MRRKVTSGVEVILKLDGSSRKGMRGEEGERNICCGQARSKYGFSV